MFDKFGEFDSYEELNRAAAAQLYEGDHDALFILAKENGIDEFEVQDYIDGCMDQLVSPLMAAYGKLDVEAAELKPDEIMADWLTYIRLQCSEKPEMALAVRRKGKSLKGCIAQLLAWSLKNAKPVDGDILKACKITYRVTLGIPGMGTAKKLIRAYYLGEEAGC